MITKEILLSNGKSLHARPATLFVQTASKYGCSVTIDFQNKRYNGKSILSVLSAGIAAGTSFRLTADGEDEKKAIADLDALVQGDFGE